MDFNVFLGISCVCSLLIQQTEQCIETNNGQSLPSFGDYGGGTGRINRFYQAIVPSYEFQCCGEIRAWGVDVEPDGGDDQRQYNLNLQVWRPSPTVAMDQMKRGDYSLVGNNRFTSISLGNGIAEITPSPQDYIQFQPGDVLGFYVEEARNDDNRGVVVLTSDSYTNVLVWIASATSQTVTGCPISVGSGGDLTSMLQGAPVISISTETSGCPQILPTPPPCPTTPPPTTTMAIEEPTMAEATTEQPTTNKPTTTAEVTTEEPTTNEPTATAEITTEKPITSGPRLEDPATSVQYTGGIISTNENEPVTEVLTTHTNEAVMDDPVEQQGGSLQPLLIGTVVAILAVGILISMPFITSVLICKKRSIGDNSETIEAEQNEAYGVTGEESGYQEMAAYTAESMYSYPIVDPDQSIEVKRNSAYANSIVTKKNEAYKPVSTTSVSGATDEYDYII